MCRRRNRRRWRSVPPTWFGSSLPMVGAAPMAAGAAVRQELAERPPLERPHPAVALSLAERLLPVLLTSSRRVLWWTCHSREARCSLRSPPEPSSWWWSFESARHRLIQLLVSRSRPPRGSLRQVTEPPVHPPRPATDGLSCAASTDRQVLSRRANLRVLIRRSAVPPWAHRGPRLLGLALPQARSLDSRNGVTRKGTSPRLVRG